MKNKVSGSLLVLCCFFVMILSGAMLELVRISRAASNIMELQNKSDAHMFSVAGLYVDTLNEVSWVNKQLRRITVASFALMLFPPAYELLELADIAAKGLELYQDALLLKLKLQAPVLDFKLRKNNGLPLIPNYHYAKHRRQPPIYILFMRIPGLIEFNKNIFKTACVKHKNYITKTITCLKFKDYDQNTQIMDWFATTDEEWDIRMNNAY